MTHAEDRPLLLAGVYGSPYSLKMRAVLRYRRIPFTWVLRDSRWDHMPPAPVRLIPAIAFPDDDGEYRTSAVDSSPLITRLESMYAGRSLVPIDPVVAFVDVLLEDYADEWLTKAMYHYRWSHEEAIAKAGKLLPLHQDEQMPAERWTQARRFVTDRQVGRRSLVGCTDDNRAVIEASYDRLLERLEEHLVTAPHVFGRRPGRSDMGLFGQLSQLVRWDPVSARIAVERAPRVVHWVERTDDLSWLPVDDDDWADRDGVPATVLALLAEAGRTYAPFMLANGAALASGREEVVCTIDGQEYRQAPFPYQGKCLTWVREAFAALSPADQRATRSLLDGTGCETLIA